MIDYLRRKTRKLRDKYQRLAYAPRILHAAYMHPMVGVQPPQISRLEDTTGPDKELLLRICKAYRSSNSLNASATPSMWDEHERLRRPLINALLQDDTETLRHMFSNLFGTGFLDGMSHGNLQFADETINPYGRNFVALRTVDCLLSLAEATGTTNAGSFAQQRLRGYLDWLQQDYDALYARTEKAVGFSLAMPTAGSPFVCRMNGVATAPDILRHAYLAQRLIGMGYGQTTRVLEIGGGFGTLALSMQRAGIGHVTIIDLPFVNAIQMGYLGSALSPDAVSGLHEPEAAVRLLPPDAITTLPDNSFDLVVNCDSLPEMGEQTALSYIRQIHRLAPSFVSINQEARTVHGAQPQNSVPEMMARNGGFRRTSRYRHWMEQGYVEEVYQRR